MTNSTSIEQKLETLKRIRKFLSQGLNSTQIAERMGMNQPYIAKLIAQVREIK